MRLPGRARRAGDEPMADAAEMKRMLTLGNVLRAAASVDDDMTPEMADALLRLASLQLTDCADATAEDTDASNRSHPDDMTTPESSARP
jgi:hypothetical protein